MSEWTSRTTKLMKIFDLQHNYIKHKQKVKQTRQKNSVLKIKQNFEAQMQKINTFKRHWKNSITFKHKQRQRQINQSNNLLHKNLTRVYSNKNISSLPKACQNFSPHSSTKSFLSRSRVQKVRVQQNRRLVNRIIHIESSLSLNKMQEQYKKQQKQRRKLSVMSVENQRKIKDGLSKMDINVSVYFPKIRKKVVKSKSVLY